MHTIEHVHSNITWNARHKASVHTHRYHGFDELGEWHGHDLPEDHEFLMDLERAVRDQLSPRVYTIGPTTRTADPELQTMQITLHPLGYQVWVGVSYEFGDGSRFGDAFRFEIPDHFSDRWHRWLSDYHGRIRAHHELPAHPAPPTWRHL